MIHVERGFGAVGGWYFRRATPPVEARDVADFHRLLELVRDIATELRSAELLFVDAIEFHDPQWDGPLRLTVDEKLVEELPLRATQLVAEKRRGLPFSLPSRTLLLGGGVIALPDGNTQKAPEVVWLEATAYGELSVCVATQLDAWLEFGLDGRPQHELARLNAPRLEHALGRIHATTRAEVDPLESRFTNSEGFRLLNQFDAEGVATDCTVLLQAGTEHDISG